MMERCSPHYITSWRSQRVALLQKTRLIGAFLLSAVLLADKEHLLFSARRG